jgi:hypothetical protein
MSQKKKTSKKTVSSSKKPSQRQEKNMTDSGDLLGFMQQTLAFMDNDDKQSNERGLQVDEMIESYLADLGYQARGDEDKEHYLGELLGYLDNNENFVAFKKAMNLVNLLVTLSYMIVPEADYERAMRFCLMHSRQDHPFAREMKLYYIQSLSQDEFSGIARNAEEYQIIMQRLSKFEQEYQSWVVSA